MATPTVSSPPIATSDQAVSLPRVSWDAYERLLSDDEGRRSPRLTYDRGMLEIVSPSLPHELDAHALAKVVEIVAEELDIDYLPTGSTTFRSRTAERGFEADASFYLRRASEIVGRRGIDLEADPPPDLAVEIEISSPSLDKLGVYAGLGVPEVWRAVGDEVAIHLLDNGVYRRAATSRVLPPLTAAILSRFLARSRTQPRLAWSRAVRAWVGGSGDRSG